MFWGVPVRGNSIREEKTSYSSSAEFIDNSKIMSWE